MTKTLIIFDVDGSLVYSNKIDSLCFAKTYEQQFGHAFPSIDWTQYPHVTDTVIFDTVFQQHHQRSAQAQEEEKFRNAFVAALEDSRQDDPGQFHMVPGAKAAIEQLLATDTYAVGIATGGWYAPASLKLAHVDIPTGSIFMHGADGKWSREDIIRAVLQDVETANVAYEKVVYIGDAVWDVHTTRNLQMNFIGIRRSGDHEVLSQIGARDVITDYSNFGHFLNMVHQAQPPLP